MLHSDLELRHDDLKSMNKSDFLESWPILLQKSPRLHVEIKDMVLEGSKVLIFSEVTGRLDAGTLDDVHMLVFDHNGKLLKSRGIQRPSSRAAGVDTTH